MPLTDISTRRSHHQTQVQKITVSLLLTLILALTLGCAGSRTDESTGEYIDDTVVTSRVKTQLIAEEGFDGFDISVETFKGRVQLSGFVDTEVQRDRAESIALAVDGVKSVENNISLK